MNAAHRPSCLAFVLALLAGAAVVPARAQVPTGPATAPPDSSASATADSLLPALPDSVGGAPSEVALADSLASTAPDSTSAPVEDWLGPWRPGPVDVDRALLEWTRPTDFEEAFAWLDGTSVRVAGEKGMDTFVGTGPLDVVPELLVDGLPSRNPADLDPAIYDRTSTVVRGLSTTRGDPAHAWGATAIRGTLDDPLVGRTVLNTRFTSTKHETYTREVGLRTPGSERMLRFDFREFKTEEGYDYSLAPTVLSDPDRGRSKQRQFRLGGRARTGVGEVGFEYGRGRRYARGSAVDADSHERWTGRLALVFDRSDDGAAWHARLYHLDFRDEWFESVDGRSRESRDGARLGLRVERLPHDGGLFGGIVVEQQSARFLPPSFAAADTSYVAAWTADAGVGWRAPADADLRPFASIRLVAAEHTTRSTAVGGRAGVARSLGPATLEVTAERIPRIPTLVETYGTYMQRTVTPTAGGWTYDPLELLVRPGGAMDFEIQDRATARLGGRAGHWRWSLAYAAFWLRRGIGIEPAVPSGSRVDLQVVDGVSTDLDMLEASLRYDRGFGKWRLRLIGRGHYLPGSLRPVAGRPGGWPRGALRGRVGLDREFFSVHNRLGVDVAADFMGEHYDDLTGPLGGVVPGSTVVDARAWLGIRDAEVFFAVDNLLDTERMEVLGTWRRFRQFTLGLTWDFFN